MNRPPARPSPRDGFHRHRQGGRLNLLSLWFADGTNYPGQDDIITRKHRMEGALRQWHDAMPHEHDDARRIQALRAGVLSHRHRRLGHGYLYSPNTPARSKVLVDTGHHYQAVNIEQIVAWLLDEDMLGGFHFNDRKYADDDLTLGSIDPYAVFRIFHEIRNAAEMHDKDVSQIAYMVDQSTTSSPRSRR